MEIELSVGERLHLVAAEDGAGTCRLVLTGTLDHLAAPTLAETIRSFFRADAVVILDLDGVEIYDPSMTMDLLALRREAAKVGTRLRFGGDEREQGASYRRHSRGGLLSAVRR